MNLAEGQAFLKKLYALTLDAESTHYFGALLPEFEKLVLSATLK